MKKMTNIWTVAIALLIGFSSKSYAAKIKNPTLSKVRKNLWYMGVTGPSLEEVESLIDSESKTVETAPRLPEELKKALEKSRGL